MRTRRTLVAMRGQHLWQRNAKACGSGDSQDACGSSDQRVVAARGLWQRWPADGPWQGQTAKVCGSSDHSRIKRHKDGKQRRENRCPRTPPRINPPAATRIKPSNRATKEEPPPRDRQTATKRGRQEDKRRRHEAARK